MQKDLFEHAEDVFVAVTRELLQQMVETVSLPWQAPQQSLFATVVLIIVNLLGGSHIYPDEHLVQSVFLGAGEEYVP